MDSVCIFPGAKVATSTKKKNYTQIEAMSCYTQNVSEKSAGNKDKHGLSWCDSTFHFDLWTIRWLIIVTVKQFYSYFDFDDFSMNKS